MERIAQENITCRLPYMSGSITNVDIESVCISQPSLNRSIPNPYGELRTS